MSTTSSIRARHMTAMTDPRFHVLNEGEKRLTKRAPHDTVPTYVPVAVIPLDNSDVLIERLVAHFQSCLPHKLHAESYRPHHEQKAREVLAVLGILPTTCKPRRKGAART